MTSTTSQLSMSTELDDRPTYILLSSEERQYQSKEVTYNNNNVKKRVKGSQNSHIKDRTGLITPIPGERRSAYAPSTTCIRLHLVG